MGRYDAWALARLLGEVISLRQQHLPVKVMVFNNGALSFAELEMKAGIRRR